MMLNVSNKQTFTQNSAYHNSTDITNPRPKSINQHHCLSVQNAMTVYYGVPNKRLH